VDASQVLYILDLVLVHWQQHNCFYCRLICLLWPTAIMTGDKHHSADTLNAMTFIACNHEYCIISECETVP
jgi:hypothetical protein